MNSERVALAESTKGWLLDGEGEFLRSLALSAPIGPFVEIGSYCGKSTCYIGDAAERRATLLFAVDHHHGSPEMRVGQDCHDPAVLDDEGQHETLFHLRRTLAAAQLENTVVPVVGDSKLVGNFWRTPVAFVFIDGAHDGKGVAADAALWAPHLLPGGLMAFHDTTIWDIAQVVDRHAETYPEVEGFKSIRVLRRPE